MASSIKRRGRGRPRQSPCSILDRQALLEALDSRDIFIKKTHLDGFYQALHRHHYPALADFVEQYYKNEKIVQLKKGRDNSSNAQEELDLFLPLKNAVSKKKNRNRVNLPKPFLEFIADPNNNFVTLTSKVAKVLTSADGSTTKLAVELHDGQLVESVLMRYGPKKSGNVVEKCGRASLCVSSQVGCAMACSFCATGMMGLTGNLSYTEILEQMIHAQRILAQEAKERRAVQRTIPSQENSQSNQRKTMNSVGGDLEVIRNVVFMGMGEPLDNYINVVEACRAMIDRKRWNLAHGRVTVSTVGIASKIRQLTKELPEVSLALSLHAPNQRLRSQIVPTAKNYPIEDMIDALDGHMKAYLEARVTAANMEHRSEMSIIDANIGHRSEMSKRLREKESSRRRAMIEYVMLEGETSSFECAHELGKLCENKSIVVNLIPYNQTDVKDKLRCPTQEHIMQFRRIVFSYGVFTTIRRTMGADISSACGQLVVKEENKFGDIEDGIVGSSPTTRSQTLVAKKLMKLSSLEKEYDNKKRTVLSEDGYLEQCIRPLQIATAVAASSFMISSALYLAQKRR